MAAIAAERDLLFGLLALQTGLINQAQLVAAFHAWTQASDRPMAEILAEQGALSAPCAPLVEGLVLEHLRRHGNDSERSLAAIGVGRSTRECLAQIADPQLDASLARVGAGSTEHDGDPDRTATYSVGTATSDGQRFRVLRPHARGGLGEVFVALDAELHREVALKQILEKHADDPVSRQRFVAEAEITGGLEHPGVVPVYGLGTYDGGRPYYAMRFIKGDSLKEAIDHFHSHRSLHSPAPVVGEGQGGGAGDSRDLELRKLLRRFLDICNAIDYAHSRGVIHRDIKPANVIVGKHGETLVVDWGLAKPLGRVEPGTDSGERTLMLSSASGSTDTLPGSALGTPAYMSPEQARGELDRLGPQSDVYGLGATLYCLLTGRPPYEGEDIGELLRKVQRGDVLPPRTLDAAIDRALEAVCLKAMALQPEDRYATCRALADDVERWMADEPVSAWREPLLLRARRWARRNRTAVASLAAGVLVALAGTATVLAVQTRANETLRTVNLELSAAKDREEARFNLAMDAISVFHTGISEDFLLQQTEFSVVRNRLLNGATDFYQKLESELAQQSDPRSRRAMGLAYLELGKLTVKVGSPTRALEQLRRSVEVRRQLAQGSGSAAESRAELGRSLVELGKILVTYTGSRAEATKDVREAIGIFEELTSSATTGERYRADLADALEAMSSAQDDVDRDGAESLLHRALAIREALVRESPSDSKRQVALANTLFLSAVHLNEIRDVPEAIATYERVAAILESYAKDDQAGSFDRDMLANTYTNLGAIFESSGRRAEQKAAIERMIAVRESLVKLNPAVWTFQNNLGHGLNTMGYFFESSGRTAEALSAYGRARDVLESAIKAHPESAILRGNLTTSLQGITDGLVATGNRPEALEQSHRLIEAVDEFERLLKTHYQSVPASRQDRLASAHTNKADLLRALGRFAEAQDGYVRAFAIREGLVKAHPKVVEYLSHLAYSVRRLGLVRLADGDAAGAGAVAHRAAALYESLPSRDGEELYETACCHAALAAAAVRDRSGNSTGEAEAAKAIDLIRRAVTAAYRNKSAMAQETALDTLRDRPDFQLLMMDLAFPADLFARPR
jgi:eukaryotic-like serine/threonine-protein kinase